MSQDGGGRSDRSRGFLDREGRTLPERIRHRRTARGLRSYALARALDVSPSYVTMIERGKKVPSEDIAVAIARLLGDDPELYRAWVHSTRFTDPQSTLRGLQRLSYSGPQASNRSVAGSARLQRASQRARRKREDASPLEEAAVFAQMLETGMAEGLEVSHSMRLPNRESKRTSPDTPLIAFGSMTGSGEDKQVTFWRLPWALLDNDIRPGRFVVCATPDPTMLIVATPSQFLDVVMADPTSDPMHSDAWRGWDDAAAGDTHGGCHSQAYDPRGKFALLLQDRRVFLRSVGDSVDVIVREGASVSIRRLSSEDLGSLLKPPT